MVKSRDMSFSSDSLAITVRCPCSDFTDMLRRLTNCRIIIIIITIVRDYANVQQNVDYSRPSSSNCLEQYGLGLSGHHLSFVNTVLVSPPPLAPASITGAIRKGI